MAESVLQRITQYLPRLERMLLIGLGVGIIATFFSNAGSLIVSVSVAGLATTFFLYAYKAPERSGVASGRSAFRELMTGNVIPKVLWISSAVSAMGVLFFLIRMNNESSERMLTIGSASIFIALVALGILRISGTTSFKAIEPVLLRAIPLLVIDCYLLFGHLWLT